MSVEGPHKYHKSVCVCLSTGLSRTAGLLDLGSSMSVCAVMRSPGRPLWQWCPAPQRQRLCFLLTKPWQLFIPHSLSLSPPAPCTLSLSLHCLMSPSPSRCPPVCLCQCLSLPHLCFSWASSLYLSCSILASVFMLTTHTVLQWVCTHNLWLLQLLLPVYLHPWACSWRLIQANHNKVLEYSVIFVSISICNVGRLQSSWNREQEIDPGVVWKAAGRLIHHPFPRTTQSVQRSVLWSWAPNLFTFVIYLLFFVAIGVINVVCPQEWSDDLKLNPSTKIGSRQANPSQWN